MDTELTLPDDDVRADVTIPELCGVRLPLRLGCVEPLLEPDPDNEAEAERLTGADVLAALEVALAAKLPMVLRDVQSEDDGAGCAGGVTGSPWKNVDVPYTPMG